MQKQFYTGARKRPHAEKFDVKAMDRDLMRAGLVNDRAIESIGTKRDFARSARGKSASFRFPYLSSCLTTSDELMAFFFRVATDSDFKDAVLNHPLIWLETSGEAFGGGSWDLKHSHLSSLFDRGHFEPERCSKRLSPPDAVALEAIAYLTLKGVTREWELEQIFPYLPFLRYQALQSKVFAEVEKTLPANFRRFLDVMESFTTAQREAVSEFYFRNRERSSKREIAIRLAINVKSFDERLEGAVRKIKKEFRELTPVEDLRPSYWKTLFERPDRRQDGMLYQSKVNHVHPLYRIDSVTGGRREIAPRSGKLPLPVRAEAYIKRKDLERRTNYTPSHDGVMSPKYAHLPNVFLATARSRLVRERRSHLDFQNTKPGKV